MATIRPVSSVVLPDTFETLPQYPWRITDPHAPEASFSTAPSSTAEIEIEWQRAYAELHASDAAAAPNGSSAWSLAANKLHQFRALWPLLQRSEIRSMKGR